MQRPGHQGNNCKMVYLCDEPNDNSSRALLSDPVDSNLESLTLIWDTNFKTRLGVCLIGGPLKRRFTVPFNNTCSMQIFDSIDLSRIPLQRLRTIAPERGWGGHFHTFAVFLSALLFAGMWERSTTATQDNSHSLRIELYAWCLF